MATRKKKSPVKSLGRRAAGARDRARTALARHEAELPPNLRDFSKKHKMAAEQEHEEAQGLHQAEDKAHIR